MWETAMHISRRPLLAPSTPLWERILGDLDQVRPNGWTAAGFHMKRFRPPSQQQFTARLHRLRNYASNPRVVPAFEQAVHSNGRDHILLGFLYSAHQIATNDLSPLITAAEHFIRRGAMGFAAVITTPKSKAPFELFYFVDSRRPNQPLLLRSGATLGG